MRRIVLLLACTGCCSTPTTLDVDYTANYATYRALAVEVISRSPGILTDEEAEVMDALAASAKAYEALVKEAP